MHRATTLRILAAQQTIPAASTLRHGRRNRPIVSIFSCPRPPFSATNDKSRDDRWPWGWNRRHIGCDVGDVRVRGFSSDAEGSAAVVESAESLASGEELNKKIISLSESGNILQAGQLLSQAQQHALHENNPQLLPTIDSYTSYMSALARSQGQLARDEEEAVRTTALAEKAHELLADMEDISGVSEGSSSMRLSGAAARGRRVRAPSLKPATAHYDCVIEAVARAAATARRADYACNFTANAPYISQRWLSRMEALSSANSGVAPTIRSYRHVMEACSFLSANRQSKAAILAQAIFDKLKLHPNLSPTVKEYRLLLRAWSESGCKDSAYKATGVWMAMHGAFKRGEEGMEPTLEDGKMVLESWSRAVNKHSARRALNILTQMEKLHTTKKTTIRPDLDCYRFVLAAMARSKVPEAGSNIPKLFKAMEDNQLFPDTECYDLAIEALTNYAALSAAEEDAREHSELAERMLVQMETERERSSASVVKPSARSYANAIRALAAGRTKHAAEKAAALLERMETEFAAGDESMKPNRDSYVGVVRAHGDSGSGKGFVRADEALRRMIAQYSNGNEAARPDACSYHAVIRACCKVPNSKGCTPEREKEALLLAISAVQDMKKSEHLHPNAKSYLLLLRCCINLLPAGDEREKALRSVFRSCSKDGLVSQQMLREFQSAVSPDTYHREVVSDAPYYDEVRIIPEKWTRNLGYRVRVKDALQDGGKSLKRSPVISVTGAIVSSTAYNDYRMRRRWLKKGKLLLQGGRI